MTVIQLVRQLFECVATQQGALVFTFTLSRLVIRMRALPQHIGCQAEPFLCEGESLKCLGLEQTRSPADLIHHTCVVTIPLHVSLDSPTTHYAALGFHGNFSHFAERF